MGHLEIVRYLIELGADVNAAEAPKFGCTALEGAASNGRLNMLQLLLHSGAATEGLHRKQYIKAVLVAEKGTHTAAAGLLRQHRDWTAEDDGLYEQFKDEPMTDSDDDDYDDDNEEDDEEGYYDSDYGNYVDEKPN